MLLDEDEFETVFEENYRLRRENFWLKVLLVLIFVVAVVWYYCVNTVNINELMKSCRERNLTCGGYCKSRSDWC